MNYQLLQEYWWLLISVLGSLLVFMLFVQGGQSMIPQMKEEQREDMIYTIAHRWELTFTVLLIAEVSIMCRVIRNYNANK